MAAERLVDRDGNSTEKGSQRLPSPSLNINTGRQQGLTGHPHISLGGQRRQGDTGGPGISPAEVCGVHKGWGVGEGQRAG